jgi:hypothetical protein
MSKATLKVFSALFIAGAFIVTSFTSCKAQPDCGAYQGSKKSVRSFSPKKNNRHAEAVSMKITREI